jgi:endonuclease YncB( thermonuclease family)
MRPRNFLYRFRPPLAQCAIAVLAALAAFPSLAGNAVVKDGNAVQFGEVTYQLAGIAAPELDQMCIDDHADPWSCGIEARDRLNKLIGGRDLRCEDEGVRKPAGKRHLVACTAVGDTVSLNQQLVRQGFAMDADGSLKEDESEARKERRGLWRGCFVAPQDFRLGKQDAPLLGAACRADRDREIRDVLFPDNLVMPPGCSIKGKFAVRARLTGNRGIYHLQGCPSYAGLSGPDRWFCSEDDARAAGFRRAYNCRAARTK